MLKKMMLVCMCYVPFSIADGVSVELEQKKIKSNNSTSVGSKSYNNNTYKPLELKGQEDKKYYTESNFKDRQNSPSQTGTSAYSNRTFPVPAVTGESDKKYYSTNEIKNGPNQPDQGSKSYSNRTFPVPEIEEHSNKHNMN